MVFASDEHWACGWGAMSEWFIVVFLRNCCARMVIFGRWLHELVLEKSSHLPKGGWNCFILCKSSFFTHEEFIFGGGHRRTCHHSGGLEETWFLRMFNIHTITIKFEFHIPSLEYMPVNPSGSTLLKFYRAQIKFETMINHTCINRIIVPEDEALRA